MKAVTGVILANLHPNWSELRQSHMGMLRNMIDDNHPQAWEARKLLKKAEAEYREIEAALAEKTVRP